MNDTIIIYRPFKSIAKSVSVLEQSEVFITGKVNIYLTIRSILSKINKLPTKFNDNLIEQNLSVAYYYNNGTPFLYDLLMYYDCAYDRWIDEGGLPYDHLEKLRPIIHKLSYRNKKANWTSAMARTHKLYLLNKNRFWYKRHWMEYRNLHMLDNSLFVDDKPRGINKSDLKKVTYEIQKY